MGTSWGDITEGVRIEVPNSDSSLPMKVYWIASIIKLAGKSNRGNLGMHPGDILLVDHITEYTE